MNLGLNFATALSDILSTDKHRFSKLNLRKNLLLDQGVAVLMEAVSLSSSIIELDLASNEIGNEGMVAIFSGLTDNNSVISLNLATIEGVARNRISATGI